MPSGNLVYQAITLSSGTLGQLAGVKKYSQIYIVQREFVEYCEKREDQNTIWQDAWIDFIKDHKERLLKLIS